MNEYYKLQNYQWPIPKELIATYPAKVRGESRLMVVHRRTQQIEHRSFNDLKDYLNAGDLLIVNNTQVLPARVNLVTQSGKNVAALMIPDSEVSGTSSSYWRVLGKGLRLQQTLILGQYAVIPQEKLADGSLLAKVESPYSAVIDYLTQYGHMPLPPYILKKRAGIEWSEDQVRYQTLYAKANPTYGSVAAPTAGLHFNQKQIANLKAHGVHWQELTLQVGRATFQPIQVDDIREHKMGKEWYRVPVELQKALEQTRAQGKKIVAVGTTVVRALESFKQYKVSPGVTELFIYPGYEVSQISALLTNFHLPGSSLLLLVSAFAGEALMRKAYREAVEKRYHFYSYGDAMLIL